MLKINDRFTIDKDTDNWILREHKPGTSRDGKPITSERLRFFGTLTTLVHFVLELGIDPNGDMSGLRKSLRETHRDLSKMLKDHAHLVKGKV